MQLEGVHKAERLRKSILKVMSPIWVQYSSISLDFFGIEGSSKMHHLGHFLKISSPTRGWCYRTLSLIMEQPVNIFFGIATLMSQEMTSNFTKVSTIRSKLEFKKLVSKFSFVSNVITEIKISRRHAASVWEKYNMTSAFYILRKLYRESRALQGEGGCNEDSP
mgnify:CR=1 FL=1